jgi:hypothetical protein
MMSSTRIFVSAAVLTVVAVTVLLPAGGAAARSSAAQNLTITATGILKTGAGGLASGASELQGASGAETDVGKLTFTEGALLPLPKKTPEGLAYVPLRFPVTFTGKHGTIVIRVNARQFDVVKQDDSIATGTWAIAKGTGRYAGMKGGGTLIGMQSTAGRGSISDYTYQFRFQGRVTKA